MVKTPVPEEPRFSDINRFAHMAMLYDFYGTLLTDKQRDIIEMYYMQNLSLTEIAELSSITRQAAGILINRTKKLLINYESKLNLVEAHGKYKKNLANALDILHGVINSQEVGDSVKDKLEEVVDNLTLYSSS